MNSNMYIQIDTRTNKVVDVYPSAYKVEEKPFITLLLEVPKVALTVAEMFNKSK